MDRPMKTLNQWLAEPTVEIAGSTCPGCGQRLLPGEPCAICETMARIRDQHHRRLGRGAFLELSQPHENIELDA